VDEWSVSDSDHTSGCGGHGDEERSAREPAYRKALWIVVVLNGGFGLIELVGGFVAGSQALRADALDFLGDGSITFIGLLALGWGGATRARVALAQGLFLAVLALGVIGMAVWRALNVIPPEAELMGGIGIAALAVNVAAALILARFRDRRDAQARAIWLFSRNDALGNLAVIVAAGLVFWLDSAWPDILVAGAIAGLFLHSSWEIVRGARREIRKGSRE